MEPRYAQTVGIAVDHRRTNKSDESFQLNVNRLVEYKGRLVVLSKKSGGKIDVPQLTTEIVARPRPAEAVSFVKLDDVSYFPKPFILLNNICVYRI